MQRNTPCEFACPVYSVHTQWCWERWLCHSFWGISPDKYILHLETASATGWECNLPILEWTARRLVKEWCLAINSSVVSGIISILLESVTSPCISFGSSGLLLLTPALLPSPPVSGQPLMLVEACCRWAAICSGVSEANFCCWLKLSRCNRASLASEVDWAARWALSRILHLSSKACRSFIYGLAWVGSMTSPISRSLSLTSLAGDEAWL